MRLMYTSPSSRAEGNTLPEGKEQQFTQTQVGLLGLGAYVPAAVLTNDDWAKYVDTSDEWITARTGIKRRHIAAEEECTADLARALIFIEERLQHPEVLIPHQLAKISLRYEQGGCGPAQHYPSASPAARSLWGHKAHSSFTAYFHDPPIPWPWLYSCRLARTKWLP